MGFFGEKLVIKMWMSLVDAGVGGLLAPWQEKRLGRARAEVRHDEMILIAEAERKIISAQKNQDNVISTLSAERQTRLSGPVSFQEPEYPTFDIDLIVDAAAKADAHHRVKRQINLSRAVVLAEEALEFEKHFSSTFRSQKNHFRYDKALY